MVGGLLSDRRAYRYLPASTAYLPSPIELLALLTDAGFSQLPPGAARYGRRAAADRDQAMSAVRPAPDLPVGGGRHAISSSGTATAPVWSCSATTRSRRRRRFAGDPRARRSGPRRSSGGARPERSRETPGLGIAMGALPFEGSCEAVLRLPERVMRGDAHARRHRPAAGMGGDRARSRPTADRVRGRGGARARGDRRGRGREGGAGANPAGGGGRGRSIRACSPGASTPSEPGAFVFLVALPGGASSLVGASPELVVRRRGRKVFSDPLAGTARRSRGSRAGPGDRSCNCSTPSRSSASTAWSPRPSRMRWRRSARSSSSTARPASPRRRRSGISTPRSRGRSNRMRPMR